MKVLFSRPKKANIFSTLVRVWQGWSQEAHVALVLDDEDGPMVYEASHFYVHSIPLDKWKERNLITASFHFEINEEPVGGFCKSSLQTVYGFGNLVSVVFWKLFKKSVFVDGKRTMICSEFVARAMLYSSELREPTLRILLCGNKKPDQVSPQDLRNFLESTLC